MARKLLTMVVFALAACSPSIKDYKDGMKRGVEAQRAGDLGKAEKYYTAALDIADKAGDGGVARWAGDAAAQMALEQKAPERALAIYDRLTERYPGEVRGFGGRPRMTNNRAVLLVRAGRVDEGLAAIGGALKDFEGNGISPAFPFEPHAILARNFLAMHSRHPWDAGCEAAYQSTLAWAVDDVERDKSGQFTWGASALFRALGDFASRSPRPGEAADLYEMAAAAKSRDHSRARGDDREWCETLTVYKFDTRACYEILE